MMSAGDDEWRTSEAELILGRPSQVHGLAAYRRPTVHMVLAGCCIAGALWLFVRGNLLDKLSVCALCATVLVAFDQALAAVE